MSLLRRVKNREEDLVREAIEAMIDEFTGVGAIAGYTLPLGMAVDPESLSLKGKWKKKKKKKSR